MLVKKITFFVFGLFFVAILQSPVLGQSKKTIPTIPNNNREYVQPTKVPSLRELQHYGVVVHRGTDGQGANTCTRCKNGITTNSTTKKCKNCIEWEDSYRNIKGCDVCKNRTWITTYTKGKCNYCNGSTIDPYVREKIMEEKIQDKINKVLGNTPTFRSLTCAKPYSGVKVELSPEMIGMDTEKYSRSYVVASLIKSDQSENNIYFLLACIMTGDRKYSVVKSKLDVLLEFYQFNSSDCPGDTEAIKTIKLELAKLIKNPNYKPKLLGTLTAEEILLFF